MTRIVRAEVLTLTLPFRFEFSHARASRSEGASVVVRLVDDEGREGHGEGAPREYVTGETIDTARGALVAHLLPAVLGNPVATVEETVGTLAGLRSRGPRDQNAAFCALELALLDLAGHVEGRSAGAAIGPVVRQEVPYGAVVSAGGVAEGTAACRRIAKYGFRDVKVKVGVSADADLALLRAARDVLGRGCSLRVDANGAWKREEALRQIEAFAPMNLAAVEEPVAPGDVESLAWLTARSPVPIVVDESLASLEDAMRLVELQACHVFNVRVSKIGGLAQAAYVVEVARRAGLGWMLGAHVGESALLSAAGRHLATRCEGGRWFEGSYGELLLEEDVGRPGLTLPHGGVARALDGAGLGVEVDAAVLSRRGTDRVVLGGG